MMCQGDSCVIRHSLGLTEEWAASNEYLLPKAHDFNLVKSCLQEPNTCGTCRVHVHPTVC